ncbi:hypothetical protein ACFVKC_04205 [Streptomyces noursei]
MKLGVPGFHDSVLTGFRERPTQAIVPTACSHRPFGAAAPSPLQSR